ncbi:gluconokinase, partial [Chromobacterium piscinae]
MKYRNIVVMGVAGCGKSSIGSMLADAIGAGFIEGDSFHPPENIERMRAGIPLDDASRAGWLANLAA